MRVRGRLFWQQPIQSSDSFRITMRMTEIAYDNKLIKINYHGMSILNGDGFVHQAGLDDDLIVKEMNSIINNLNKKLKKFLSYAQIVNESTILPPPNKPNPRINMCVCDHYINKIRSLQNFERHTTRVLCQAG